MINGEHIAIFGISVAVVFGASQRNNAMEELSDKDPRSFAMQVSEDFGHALRSNAEAQSLAEWQDSGYTAADIFQNVRAHKRPDTSEALCGALNPLPGSELALFESEVEKSADLYCKGDLQLKLQKHWAKQAEGLATSPSVRLETSEIPLDPASGAQVDGSGLHSKEIVLSFNGGGSPARVERILKILEQAGVKAMFFPTGSAAQKDQETPQRIAARGHVLGAQSAHAVFVDRLNLKDAEKEIVSGKSSVELAGGQDVHFFRFPHGEAGENAQKLVADQKMATIQWNVDSQDWKVRDPRTLLRSLLAQLEKHPSGVILLHDDREQTVLMLPELLNELSKRAFRVAVFVPH